MCVYVAFWVSRKEYIRYKRRTRQYDRNCPTCLDRAPRLTGQFCSVPWMSELNRFYFTYKILQSKLHFQLHVYQKATGDGLSRWQTKTNELFMYSKSVCRCYVQISPPCSKARGAFLHATVHVQKSLLCAKKPESSYLNILCKYLSFIMCW